MPRLLSELRGDRLAQQIRCFLGRGLCTAAAFVAASTWRSIAEVLLSDDNRPIAAIGHRAEPSGAGVELWSTAVHLDGPTAVSDITPAYRLENGIKVGERARTDCPVSAHGQAGRPMQLLEASR